MTTEELRQYFNDTFGFNEWPKTFEVDAETYANVCQSIFKWHIGTHLYTMIPGVGYKIEVSIGISGGIFFKDVELILRDK
jgi:hypothetical protein